VFSFRVVAHMCSSTSLSSYSGSFSTTSSELSVMHKDPEYYLPPIVRSLGEDSIVNKVRLQCKALSDGRYLYTYSMDLTQRPPADSGTVITDASSGVSRSNQAKKASRSRQESDADTNYSVQSFHVRRPDPPKTTHNPAPTSPPKSHHGFTDMTMRSNEDEHSKAIRQEVTITFYLFGQTDRGDYFRRRLYDSFVANTSIRRVLRAFAEVIDRPFKDFVDHLYILPGSGQQLKDATKWQKLPRDHISLTIGDLRYEGDELDSEIVFVVDLVGVRDLSPAMQRSMGKQ
ncbi:hypothetical protein PFISCL1PPCAC_22510, partial [Pristionchus fissidentatus]